MPDARDIYEGAPALYDALVGHEDHTGALLPAIRSIAARAGLRLDGADVVELGAGTGRLSALLAPHVRSLRGFDRAQPMVARARARLAALGATHCTIEVADNARLPLPDATADLAVAGWTVGHQTVWAADGGGVSIAAALDELERMLKEGGLALVIETLGTGHETPFDPPPPLAAYYRLLTERRGYAREWIRTDYLFPSVAEGAHLLRSFFGEALADAYLARGQRGLPECTGLWWRRK